MVLSSRQYFGLWLFVLSLPLPWHRGLPWTTEFLSCRSGSVGDADPAPEAAPPQVVVFPSGGLLLEGR